MTALRAIRSIDAELVCPACQAQRVHEAVIHLLCGRTICASCISKCPCKRAGASSSKADSKSSDSKSDSSSSSTLLSSASASASSAGSATASAEAVANAPVRAIVQHMETYAAERAARDARLAVHRAQYQERKIARMAQAAAAGGGAGVQPAPVGGRGALRVSRVLRGGGRISLSARGGHLSAAPAMRSDPFEVYGTNTASSARQLSEQASESAIAAALEELIESLAPNQLDRECQL